MLPDCSFTYNLQHTTYGRSVFCSGHAGRDQHHYEALSNAKPKQPPHALPATPSHHNVLSTMRPCGQTRRRRRCHLMEDEKCMSPVAVAVVITSRSCVTASPTWPRGRSAAGVTYNTLSVLFSTRSTLRCHLCWPVSLGRWDVLGRLGVLISAESAAPLREISFDF